MDAPKKQILYRPESNQRVKNKLAENKFEKEQVKKDNQLKDGERLAKWIVDAEILNKSALCKASKIDRGNLDKYLSKGVIPDQHIAGLVLILKNYGYAE